MSAFFRFDGANKFSFDGVQIGTHTTVEPYSHQVDKEKAEAGMQGHKL
jgi:hypothetical protein